jgi:transposase
MKSAAGIDVSKDDFHVCLKESREDGRVRILGSRSFPNDYNGFNAFLSWTAKNKKAAVGIKFVMEATGSYYEDSAYFLYENHQLVYVVLANKIKHYAKSLNIKTKTDKADAKMIADFGLERNLTVWQPMSKEYKQLRDLCRELLSMKKANNRAVCQEHALKHAHLKDAFVLKLKSEQIEFYKKSIGNIEAEITQLVKADTELRERIDKITTIKGMGMMTAVIILCETNGFQMFNNIRQVVGYAGLDVEMKESGKYKGKTRITKKGNPRIRQCLFMPALSACSHNEKIKALYDRILEKNPTIKRKGVVAAMRKLLVLTFVLWKKNEEYNPEYQWSPTKK